LPTDIFRRAGLTVIMVAAVRDNRFPPRAGHEDRAWRDEKSAASMLKLLTPSSAAKSVLFINTFGKPR
jgi:hypothetical protein